MIKNIPIKIRKNNSWEIILQSGEVIEIKLTNETLRDYRMITGDIIDNDTELMMFVEELDALGISPDEIEDMTLLNKKIPEHRKRMAYF
jgi:hypothetical protein